MGLARVIAVVAAALAGRAEIIDRVAVRVGRSVITESELRREIRLTAFLEGAPLEFSATTQRKTAERLVDQRLIRAEMEESRYPQPPPEAAEEALKQVLAERSRASLDQYGITEEELRAHLQRQLVTLRFISVRFRPGVQIEPGEIDQYLARHKSANGTPPPEEHRARIEEALIEERVNRLAEVWLKEARARTRIEFRPEVFQ